LPEATEPLVGAIDTHVHSAPDTIPRKQDDIELARTAAAAGMRAIVLKSHHFPTADRAALASRYADGITVLGGLVLNATAAGGLNPEAVRSSLTVGGRVFWLPTVSAENHQAFVSAGASELLTNLTSSRVAVPVVRDGRPVPALDAVLALLAEADAVLATGHLAPAETEAVVARAQELGVKRIVVTHPELELVSMSMEVQHRLAARGVMFERCYINLLHDGRRPAEILAAAREVGVGSTVLATDLGQANNPPAPEGLRDFHDRLAEAGMTEEEWDLMARRNPARLLGLDQVA
jgi:hypothetical protein